MNCQEVMEYMQRQLDLDLSEAEHHLLDTHLESCASCRVMMERLQRLTSELSNLPKVHPPVSLVDAIMPKLAEIDLARQAVVKPLADDAHTAHASSRTKRQGRIPYRLLGGIVAASVLLGVAIVNLGQPGEPLQVADSSSGMLSSSSNNTAAADMAMDAPQRSSEITFEMMDVVTEEAATLEEDTQQSFGFLATPEVEKEMKNEYFDASRADGGQLESEPIRGLTDKGKSGSEPVEKPALEMDTADGSESYEKVDINDLSGAASVVESPDGKYAAYVDGASVIVLDENNEKVYTSEAYAGAEIHELVWVSEDRLTFKIRSEDTEQSYYIDLTDGTEGTL